MAKKPTGTPKTETIIGTAATKLSSAVKSAKEALESVTGLEAVITENTLKVTDLENKIASLNTEYDQRNAKLAFDMDLQYKTNQKEFANQYLQEQGLIAVPVETFEKTKNELENLKKDFDSKVSAEVGKANAIKDSQMKSEKALMESEYKAKEATNLARIENLEAQLSFANEQVTMWQTALNEERKAGVERAKAASVGAVNISSGTGR